MDKDSTVCGIKRGTVEQCGDEKRGEEKCRGRLAVWEIIIDSNVKKWCY